MSGNLFGWSDALWRLLDQIGILVGYATLILPMGAAILAFFKRDNIRRWITRNRFPDLDPGDVEGMTWDGIVFTISHEETPRWVMTQLKPKYVAFVASRQSQTVAESLRDFARGLSITAELPVRTVDPNAPDQARKAIRALLSDMRELGLQKIAVDITGGKTPMSLGAFMAAEEAGAASLYVASQFDSALNKPDVRTASVHIVSCPT
jgi:hypothetical protein